MTAVWRKTLASLRRRRLQAVIIGLVVLLAAGTATLALTLLFGSTNAYDQAFAQQRGAHVLQEFTGGATTVQLAHTARAPGVTAAAGPWRTDNITVEPARVPPDERQMVADFGPPKLGLEVVGRASPAGPADDLRLVAGHWLRSGNQIVLTRSFALAQSLAVGETLNAVVGSRRVPLIIAGEVIDVDEMDAANQSPQHAWVLPATLPRLIGPGDQPGYEMAYRFRHAATNAALRADLVPIKALLPAGALGFTRSYIDVRNNYNITSALVLTFLLAFSVFALGAAALIVANIVTGAVLAGFRDIGIMKAIGFTPGQVVQMLVLQMLVPALIACVVGIPLGLLLSRPLVTQSADALGLPPPAALSLPAVLLVIAGVVTVVAVSAALPAWRAGRLSPVRAIVSGTAPQGRKAVGLARALDRLHLPPTVRLGAGQAFARPLRAGFTAVAVLVGVATVTFAVGLRTTLMHGLNDPAFNGGDYQIEVSRLMQYPDARLMHTLRAQPQTQAIVARDWASVQVNGISQPVQSVFTRGDATKLGLRALQGRWYAAPGEAVAPEAFMKEAHLRVGDYFTGSINGRRLRFHLVGMMFDTAEFGRILYMDFSTLHRAMPGEVPADYLVRLRPRSDPTAYAIRVNRTSRADLTVNIQNNTASSVIATVNDVVLVLALVLAVIAAAAVFNTVLLNTRERVRDTAVLKAVGMAPRQAILMVATSAAILGLIGGILGIPAGVVLHGVILQLMANLVGNTISPLQYQAFSAPLLLGLVIAGMLVAVLGALLPARWAAYTGVAEVLHAE
ncbi:MAG TPA: ABC transporter permease [Chloroflexota bacterium]|nr:ABC transporter permease [Chloroflexota bacterium]